MNSICRLSIDELVWLLWKKAWDDQLALKQMTISWWMRWKWWESKLLWKICRSNIKWWQLQKFCSKWRKSKTKTQKRLSEKKKQTTQQISDWEKICSKTCYQFVKIFSRWWLFSYFLCEKSSKYMYQIMNNSWCES